jgi:hypothetical protein
MKDLPSWSTRNSSWGAVRVKILIVVVSIIVFLSSSLGIRLSSGLDISLSSGLSAHRSFGLSVGDLFSTGILAGVDLLAGVGLLGKIDLLGLSLSLLFGARGGLRSPGGGGGLLFRDGKRFSEKFGIELDTKISKMYFQVTLVNRGR